MSVEKVLVVYETIPETTAFAVVPMTKEERDYFFQGAGYYENLEEFDEVKSEVGNTISAALSDSPDNIEFCESEKEKEYFGKWVDFVVEDHLSELTDVKHILRCGFYL